jgi:hypothetical protein
MSADKSACVYLCTCFRLRLIFNWREQADALNEKRSIPIAFEFALLLVRPKEIQPNAG